MSEREHDLVFALLMGAAGSMSFGWLFMYVAVCGALQLLPALLWIAVSVVPVMYCVNVVFRNSGE